ncbi:zeta toxin family protein [Leucobacter soli]|uniref:Zeta toxin domain-containing protein n=1 Tax=Leucobacter soli TaxID=2812850 RepID=A0A916JUX7_9MICO|nr:zeta toxin family protein [Leucobacter soli]CAG7600800.1 hypothetical protein LEUCIP111803_00401 [Leucobacter soli]
MTEEIGSEAWLARVFAEKVRHELFDGHTPQPVPVLVLLGGQPAAGKTRAQHAILTEHGADDLVEITGDDLREFHPEYDLLADEAPFEMPAQTAPVSGGLVRLALDYAREHGYSVLLEGTFRDAGMVTRNAIRFADAGYRVEVVAVATPAAVSRLSAEMRSQGSGYPNVGRWTPPEAHETALRYSPGVLAALEALPQVGRVRVFSREGPLYENARTVTGEWAAAPEASRVLTLEQHRPLAPLAALGWLRDYSIVFRQASARPAYLGPNTAPAFLRLQDDARMMIRSLAFTPGAPLAELEQAHAARQRVLERVLPPDLRPRPRTPSGRRLPPVKMPSDPPRNEPPARGL